MDMSSPLPREQQRLDWAGKLESSLSSVSWAAVIGGAFVAAAFSLILLALGAGLGLTSVSPWSGRGVSAQAVGLATVIWLVLMQVISSAMGGYLAGRLRTKWSDVRTEEVFFRDTAHGFLTWAVAVVISAGFLGSAATALVGSAGDVVAKGASAAAVTTAAAAAGIAKEGASKDGASDQGRYFVDSLFRPTSGTANANGVASASSSATPGAGNVAGATGDNSAAMAAAPMTGTAESAPMAPATASATPAPMNAQQSAAARAEVGPILAKAVADGQLAPNDRTYLVSLIASSTGMSQADAERRVNDVVAQAQAVKTKALEATDEARHTAAALSFWTFFALLAGAFTAAFAGTIGGRHRESAQLVPVR